MTQFPTILITGGAGYIGSHVVLELKDKGYPIVVLDNFSTGRRAAVPEDVTLVEGDVGDAVLLDDIFKKHSIGAILHFAGSIVVPESVEKPIEYYTNNVTKSLLLIEKAVKHNVSAFIFSSTASVYGQAEKMPVKEDAPLKPVQPYGKSKLMIEEMLQDISSQHPMHVGILRYFNVAGCDPDLRTGQSTPNATHLIKNVAKVVTGQKDKLELFGDDYNTPDGTCIRDYIHVSDLAELHGLALDYVLKHKENLLINCGYGRGSSVKEIMQAADKVVGYEIPRQISPRRAGDVAELVADVSKMQNLFNWKPKHQDLGHIIQTAIAWEKHLIKDKAA